MAAEIMLVFGLLIFLFWDRLAGIVEWGFER